MNRLLSVPRLWLLVLLVGAAVGCSGVLSPADRVQIRIENATAFDLDDVIVGFPEQTEAYGRLAAGKSSAYRAVARAYGYAAVEVRVGDSTVRLQPIDYMGASLLEPGRYTYILHLDSLDDPYALDLELRVE